MKILGVDSSTKTANVSITCDDKLITKKIDNEVTHSEKLLPLIDNCLKELNININDIDIFACTIGPGSFTGIRIGIATLKAFAKVNNTDIFAISTLDVLAYSKISDNSNYLVSLIDAKNDRTYYRIYKVDFLRYYLKTLPILVPLCDCNNLLISDALENIESILALENTNNDTGFNVTFACDNMNFEENIIDKFGIQFGIYDIDIVESSISTETLIEMYNNYSKLGYDKDYLETYLSLDAIYARPSQAERTKNGEK